MNGLVRLAGAMAVTALASWLAFSSVHICDGNWSNALFVLTLICVLAVCIFSLPKASPGIYTMNSLGAAAVFAVAVAMDVASAGFQSPGGSQCEPILWQGWLVFGFIYMFVILVALGVLIGAGLWTLRRVRRLFNPS
jgi:hypothetical protein